MSWIDIGRDILEDFAELASLDIEEFLHGEFMQMSTFTSDGSRSERSEVCVVCGASVDRKSQTCSKRCTQSRRRKELIDAGICTACKVNPAKTTSERCSTCSAASMRETQMATCADETCKNEFVQEVHGGQPKLFCSGRCRDRTQTRRRVARRKVLNCPDKSSTVAR